MDRRQQVNYALHFLDEFRQATCRMASVSVGAPRRERWSPPSIGITAVCVDAAFPLDGEGRGTGGVIRSSEGKVLGSFIALVRRPSSPLIAELPAVLEGLRMASEMNCLKIRVQLDCNTAVQLLIGEQRLAKEEGLLVHKALSLAGSLISVEFCFVPRACNIVAHILAKKKPSYFPIDFSGLILFPQRLSELS